MTQRIIDSYAHRAALLLVAALTAASPLSSLAAAGQEKTDTTARPPAASLARPTLVPKPTDPDGFIQRWLLLEPIRVPGQLTESAVRTAIEKDYSVPATPLPHPGDKLTVGDSELTWHAVDTINYNVNLYHFAYALNKPTSNVLFWVVTVVNAPREMSGVRLAIGSNAASVGWGKGKGGGAPYKGCPKGFDNGGSEALTFQKKVNMG